MPLLSCSVVTCTHNCDQMCELENIKVEGSEADISDATSCGSFKEAGGYEGAKNSCGCKNIEKTKVDCMAQHCEYNKNKMCEAGKINVDGLSASDSKDTRCASFVRK